MTIDSCCKQGWGRDQHLIFHIARLVVSSVKVRIKKPGIAASRGDAVAPALPLIAIGFKSIALQSIGKFYCGISLG
jgi:hypothetical protein